ncbi:hypothetical protein HCBG_04013 [Histoplasma capsulatum G186AR]|uniref:Uncharacterized protein n=2 Tax=Ajellomyces capsulatus TaxID=5037 RepID=C0NMN6_AJECG|nr:uncharacterized protein HCBG_04013 [Histoplasma capsulatum G186AR]EEH07134.1 hypothetical protein HCBG_04013 [Histoplasma capsulatum G186AR]KAG5287842.1 hypothetical protein I7I52_11749 [Histoplasma capsulatum]QSS70342.1 hypothetical protein I7I50_11939 [Histoplasma capsulatum G186AR]
MLLLSFLGLVASLTLWGTFFPVPYTDIRPHGSFVERVTGAIRASFFLTGTYEFVLTANSKAAGAFQHERPGSFAGFSGLPRLPSDAYLDGMYCNSSSWVFIPSGGTVASPNTCFSRDMYSGSSSEIGLAVEAVEPSRVAIGGVEMDDAAQSAKSSSFLLELAVGSLAIIFVCWLSLKLISIAYTREDLALSFGRLFVPSPEVAKHFVMTSGLTVTINMSNDVALVPISDAYEVVTAMIESSMGMGQSGVNPIYYRENGPVFTDSVAVCDVPLSSLALVTGSQLVEYSFHPVVDVIINRLARQQIGTPVNWSNCIAADSDAIPVERVNNEPGSTSLLPASVASVRMPQLTALVLRRLENISHFVLLRLVFVIVANAGDGQTAAENRSSTDKEEGPSERPKRNRMGQRQRRRLYQREMRKQQAELIDRLEMESDGGSNPPPQAPPAPLPASPVGHAASSTVAPMAPIRPAMPVNLQGQGNGFRPPHPHPPPPFRQFPVVARQPPVPGQGGQMPPFPWPYQQYGYPHYPHQRF